MHSGWDGVLEAVIECRFDTLKFCDCLADAYDTLCFYYLFYAFFFYSCVASGNVTLQPRLRGEVDLGNRNVFEDLCK